MPDPTLRYFWTKFREIVRASTYHDCFDISMSIGVVLELDNSHLKTGSSLICRKLLDMPLASSIRVADPPGPLKKGA